VQNVNAEGVISLHSRSLKYGKLENGHLVIVPCALIRRLSHHYVTLACGVDVILGKNGWIWVTR
jgi:exosome complex component RRP4